MNYTISNEKLTLVVSSKGGEFQSVKDAEGQEYLWQGDAATWTDRGPNLFPYIGRMTEKSYKYQDTVYHMDIHGFLPYDEMELVEQKADSLTLRLVSSPETRKQYPFEFTLDITWKLEGEKITITYQVKNTDDKKMYFGIGGHPGFQIPIEKNLKFEDYRIDFGEDSKPRRILFSEDCFVLEEDEAFALEEGRYLNLEHNLFDDDAIVLKEMPREVTLESAKGSKKITVAFPRGEYWNTSGSTGPVCGSRADVKKSERTAGRDGKTGRTASDGLSVADHEVYTSDPGRYDGSQSISEDQFRLSEKLSERRTICI